MYAIKSNGAGNAPSMFEHIGQSTVVPDGYDFVAADHPAGMVVAEDGASLREPTTAEIDAINNPVPEEVDRAQARIALHQAGLLSQVEAIIADPATDPVTVIAYNDAKIFRRDSVVLQSLAAALGLTEQELDDLFLAASQVVI